MVKKRLVIAFAMSMSLVPLRMSAMEIVQDDQELLDRREISITVNQQALTVTGAEGLMAQVVSLTGNQVASVKIESPVQRIELNLSRGCYIVRVGKVVRKVSVR